MKSAKGFIFLLLIPIALLILLRPANEEAPAPPASIVAAAPQATEESGFQQAIFQPVKRSVIRGMVQDQFNQPVEGVRVLLEYSPGMEFDAPYYFSATTDREGRFEWMNAPDHPMPFYFGKDFPSSENS
jgi:hypothetical protein